MCNKVMFNCKEAKMTTENGIIVNSTALIDATNKPPKNETCPQRSAISDAKRHVTEFVTPACSCNADEFLSTIYLTRRK